jgi:hypothetical protein
MNNCRPRCICSLSFRSESFRMLNCYLGTGTRAGPMPLLHPAHVTVRRLPCSLSRMMTRQAVHTPIPACADSRDAGDGGSSTARRRSRPAGAAWNRANQEAPYKPAEPANRPSRRSGPGPAGPGPDRGSILGRPSLQRGWQSGSVAAPGPCGAPGRPGSPGSSAVTSEEQDATTPRSATNTARGLGARWPGTPANRGAGILRCALLVPGGGRGGPAHGPVRGPLGPPLPRRHQLRVPPRPASGSGVAGSLRRPLRPCRGCPARRSVRFGPPGAARRDAASARCT